MKCYFVLNKLNSLRFISITGPNLPETATVHILTEPLLEIFKEEPQLEVVREESLPDICTNPTESDSIPEVPLFCALCLRPCTSGQLVEFSTEPSGRDKLALLLGVEIQLEQCAICRSCWIMVETFADFREGCLKASAWRERFPFGLDGAGDDWLSKEDLEVMARTRKVVQEHVERIENARNRHKLISDELPEEKPMLADNQHLEEDVNYPLVPDEPPNDKYGNYTVFPSLKNNKQTFSSSTGTAQILDQTGKTSFSCEKCQRMFETKLGIALHLRRCTKSSKTKLKLYTCSICSVNFTKSYRLREHRNKHMG